MSRIVKSGSVRLPVVRRLLSTCIFFSLGGVLWIASYITMLHFVNTSAEHQMMEIGEREANTWPQKNVNKCGIREEHKCYVRCARWNRMSMTIRIFIESSKEMAWIRSQWKLHSLWKARHIHTPHNWLSRQMQCDNYRSWQSYKNYNSCIRFLGIQPWT